MKPQLSQLQKSGVVINGSCPFFVFWLPFYNFWKLLVSFWKLLVSKSSYLNILFWFWFGSARFGLEVQESACWHLWHENVWMNMYDFLHSHDKYLYLLCFGRLVDIRKNWPVCPHSTPIMTIYPITVDSRNWNNIHMQTFARLPQTVKRNIWQWYLQLRDHDHLQTIFPSVILHK